MNNNLSQYVRAAKNGDREAFVKLFRSTSQRAYYTALKLTKNQHDAEDMVQEAYIKAFSSINTLEDDDRFESWFNQIVANKCRDLAKKKKPDLFSDFEMDDEDEPFEDNIKNADLSLLPEEVTENKSVRRLVMSSIDKLSDEQRMCVIMYYYNELSVGEIAQALEIPAGTVKGRLSKARKVLKSDFEDIERRDNIKLRSVSLPLVMYYVLQSGGESCNAPKFMLYKISRGVSELASGGFLAGLLKALGITSAAQKVIAGVGAVAIATGGTLGVSSIVSEKKGRKAEPTSVVAEYSDKSVSASKSKQKTTSNTTKKSSKKTKATEKGSSKKTTQNKARRQPSFSASSNNSIAVTDRKNGVYYICEEGIVYRSKDGKLTNISQQKPSNISYYDGGVYYISDGFLYKLANQQTSEVMKAKGDLIYCGSDGFVSITDDGERSYYMDMGTGESIGLEVNCTDFKYCGGKLYCRSPENDIICISVNNGNPVIDMNINCDEQKDLLLPYCVYGDSLYYTDFDSDESGIINIVDLATGEAAEAELETGITDYSVSDGAIIYSSAEGGLYRYSDAESKKLLDGRYYCGAASVGDSLWCRTDDKTAYLVSENRSDPISVENGTDILEFNVIGDKMFYRTAEGYGCVELQG